MITLKSTGECIITIHQIYPIRMVYAGICQAETNHQHFPEIKFKRWEDDLEEGT